MWLDSIAAINKYLADEVKDTAGISPKAIPDLWYGHADMNTGKRTATTYGALDAFFPAVLALFGDLNRARRLQESSFKMWRLHNVEPEEIDYLTMAVASPGYPLRPEIVESTYYLYHYAIHKHLALSGRGTRSSAGRMSPLSDPLGGSEYLGMGETLFRNFKEYCKTDEGYAGLKNVVTKEKSDSMQSFLFAETFKYFYLLFAPPTTLNFDKVIFNTEAHPIRRTW